MARRRRPVRRPARRGRRAVAVQAPGWKHPVCYLTHRSKGYTAEDLVYWVEAAIEAAGGNSVRWAEAAGRIDTCGEGDEGDEQGQEGMRELLLLAHKFVEIR